jgi:hypothetical protein
MRKIKELFSKKVPAKNYYIVLGVSVLIIVSILYSRKLYLNYLDNSKVSSFEDKTINQINNEDFDYALTEVSEAILYVSNSSDEDVASIDKKIYKLFKKKSLIDKVIFWDVSDIYKSGEYMSSLRNKFPEVSEKISIAPLVIYIKDGKAQDAISSEVSLIDVDDVKELIEKNEVE